MWSVHAHSFRQTHTSGRSGCFNLVQHKTSTAQAGATGTQGCKANARSPRAANSSHINARANTTQSCSRAAGGTGAAWAGSPQQRSRRRAAGQGMGPYHVPWAPPGCAAAAAAAGIAVAAAARIRLAGAAHGMSAGRSHWLCPVCGWHGVGAQVRDMVQRLARGTHHQVHKLTCSLHPQAHLPACRPLHPPDPPSSPWWDGTGQCRGHMEEVPFNKTLERHC